jgi:hypothetical protein
MKTLFCILLVLIVALVLVAPVAAQDGTPAFVTLTPMPEEGEVAPVEEDVLIPVGVLKDLNDSFTSQIQTLMLLAFGALMVFLVFVLLPVVVALYLSNPSFRSTIKTAALEGLTLIEGEIVERKDEAAKNDVDWDDPIWRGIYEAIKSGRVKLENLGLETTAVG